jgi:hypothetical protein
MAGQLGESGNDASDKNNTNRTRGQPANVVACGSEAAVDEPRKARTRETSRGQERQQGGTAGSESCSGSA